MGERHRTYANQPLGARLGDERVANALRAPLLGADWAAWAEAWRAVDAGALPFASQ